jgi:hypothetical protein
MVGATDKNIFGLQLNGSGERFTSGTGYRTVFSAAKGLWLIAL